MLLTVLTADVVDAMFLLILQLRATTYPHFSLWLKLRASLQLAQTAIQPVAKAVSMQQVRLQQKDALIAMP
jgi:hypothetical protein